MAKKKDKESTPFFIINVGTKENPVLKYTYKKEEK